MLKMPYPFTGVHIQRQSGVSKETVIAHRTLAQFSQRFRIVGIARSPNGQFGFRVVATGKPYTRARSFRIV